MEFGSGAVNVNTTAFAAAAMLVAIGAPPAQAAPECADAVRALIQGSPSIEIPVKSRSTTTMAGGQVMVNLGLTEGKNHLTMDENGDPVSLFREDKFYTTADKGETWTLVQTYSPEVMAQTREGLASQAENATNITCTYGVDLDGRSVNHFTVDYAIYNTGTPVHSEYWVDAETGFAWKTRTVSDPGGNEIIIEQVSEPAPGESPPDPDS
jgi:hypothetical protein